jgi:hypothetical protein
VSAAQVAVGGTVTVSGGGFAPGSSVALTLRSDPVSLGTTRADANGAISTRVTIPAGTSQGQHRIFATGVTASGAPRILEVAVTVRGSQLPRTGTSVPAELLVSLLAAGVACFALAQGRELLRT